MFLEVQGNQVKSTAFFSKKNKQLSHNFLFICWVLKEKKLFIVEYDNGLSIQNDLWNKI